MVANGVTMGGQRQEEEDARARDGMASDEAIAHGGSRQYETEAVQTEAPEFPIDTGSFRATHSGETEDASTCARQATSRLGLAVEDAAYQDTGSRNASAFQTWTSTSPGSPASRTSPSETSGAYKIGPFVLLLLDEFCRHYSLTATATALQTELLKLGVEIPSADLWFDMYGQCSSILTNRKLTNPVAGATTIERLVEFCVSPQLRKTVATLDAVAAHSPMRVCASPKRATATSTPTGGGFSSLMTAYQQLRSPIARPSQRPSNLSVQDTTPPPPPIAGEPDGAQGDQQFVHAKKKKKKKPRRHTSHSALSQPSHPQQPTPGTYGEPALVQTHLTELRRDLTSTRMLEKELRHVRLETILMEPTISTQKKLGFYTLSPDERRAWQQLQDPYANELVLEKYGFSKRQECALCQFPFLQFNLPHKVSFKCIMDVYDHWQYLPPDRATASKYKPPLCYDAVHVCRLCAQIVFQFTKQPEAQKVTRPLSRNYTKAKSLANLHRAEPMDDPPSFCSDPYALPPLLGDDVYDHRDVLSQYNTNGRRRGLRGEGEPSDSDGRAVAVSEFPAKAIVYSQQVDGAPFMSAKEWDVINPEKSATRHRMEASLAAAASRGARG